MATKTIRPVGDSFSSKYTPTTNQYTYVDEATLDIGDYLTGTANDDNYVVFLFDNAGLSGATINSVTLCVQYSETNPATCNAGYYITGDYSSSDSYNFYNMPMTHQSGYLWQRTFTVNPKTSFAYIPSELEGMRYGFVTLVKNSFNFYQIYIVIDYEGGGATTKPQHYYAQQ